MTKESTLDQSVTTNLSLPT